MNDILNKTFGLAPPCKIGTGARPGLGEYFFCAKAGAMHAYFGERAKARQILSALGKDYMLPPYFTTTETVSPLPGAGGGPTAFVRSYGHYLTNWGAQLQAVLFGLTGLRLGDGPEASWLVGNASLPEGWDGIFVERLWLRGEEYSMTARHGSKTVLTKLIQP